MNIIIVPVTLDRVVELQKISQNTFEESFSVNNSNEDIQIYLTECLSITQLNKELNTTESKFFFALIGTEICGYLKVNTPKSIEGLSVASALEIERIYILKKYQGKMIGQTLYNHAILLAKEARAECIWLGVWEMNFQAIKFYKKNGMIAFGSKTFKLGNDLQNDILMQKFL